jgi:rRNA maturation endonuclease Nob1
LFSPSQKTVFNRYQSPNQPHSEQMKRICNNCQKIVPMYQKKCPHCGNEFKYD